MRGLALLEQNGDRPSKDKINAALALFEQALKIDPNDADALAGEAGCYTLAYFFFANPETDYDAKVIGQADRAIALAPDNMEAYRAKSVYLFMSRRFDENLALPTLVSPSIRIMPHCMQREAPRNLLSAGSNKRNPMCNKRCA